MTEIKGKLVVEVYAIAEDTGDRMLVRKTDDGRCVSAVMNWTIANPPKSNDGSPNAE